MDKNILLVICLVVLLAAGVPAMIYAGLRGRGSIGQIELLRRAGTRIQKPWKPEDDNLAELAKRVEELQKKSGDA
jgi:hypothetical protein